MASRFKFLLFIEEERIKKKATEAECVFIWKRNTILAHHACNT